jgi:hypothetical protein
MSLKKIVFFLLFASLSYAQEILFILQDAGETQALLPVLEKLEQENKKFTVLAAGVAQDLLQGKLWMEKLPIDKSWQRSATFSEATLKQIIQAHPAKKVVSGVAFELHGQLLQAYAQQGSTTFAFWDNINYEGSDPYFATAQKVAHVAQNVLTPRAAFEKHLPHATVVGQPSIELWAKTLHQIDVKAVKARLPFLKSDQPVLLFIGGYGKEYEEAFDLFLKVAELPELQKYAQAIAFHPKMGGNFEREHLPAKAYLLEPKYGVSTQEAIALADIVVCHQSSVGVQAAAAGKRVIYLVPSHQTYTNPAIEQKIAQTATSANEFCQALQAQSKSNDDPFVAWGMPQNSVERIYNLLVQE